MLITNIVRMLHMKGHVGHWTEMVLTLQVNLLDLNLSSDKRYHLVRIQRFSICNKSSQLMLTVILTIQIELPHQHLWLM